MEEAVMESFQIFVVQVVLSFVVYGLVATWYISPRLATLPLQAALPPLIFVHTFRYVGLVFLVPAVVAPTLAPQFARPAAYGDLLVALLALAALIALRWRWPLALPLVWLFNVVGTVDLLYAVFQGVTRDVGPHLGSAWYIPTFVVPALFITHAMIFAMLVRRSR